MTRVTIYWSRVAPNSKPSNWDPTSPTDPNYDWSSPDDQLVKSAAAGVTPIIQIYSAPAWAERCVAPGEPGICNPDPVEFQKFTRAVARRYSGDILGLPKVKFWKAWNEPNLHISFKPQRYGAKRPSPLLYRELLNRFSTAVKDVDSENLVIGGGLAPLGGQNSTSPLDFMRRMLCMKGRTRPVSNRPCKGAAWFDIWAMNPYTTGGPTHAARHPDDVQMGDLPEVTTLIRAAKKAGRIKSSQSNIRLWVTEFSYDSRPPDPGGLPMSILSRWIAEAMFRTWKAGFDCFFWLSIRDWKRPAGLPYSQTFESGLWFRGDSVEKDRPKAVLKVFRAPFFAIRSRTGMTIWGRTLNSKAGNVVIRFGPRANGVSRRIKVVKANKYGLFRGYFRTKIGRNKRGFVTATSGGFTSVPYPLKPQRDFYQPPFG